ncbi:MAG: SbcC/MukB-like Walker B domain-containing protein [Deltaproteobacteria bacterium]
MKPLELRVRGLNSFRAEQTIDFKRLGEYSLFGIFGPTGSGKSSILDAIILALFGVVPRAGNGAAGTINQMEDAAEVSFRFELNAAEGRQEYLIQRRYRRDKNNPESAHFVSGRLSRVTETAAEVLASKDSEMKSKIVELLGLSAQDFTRAVVLPQGRFAEFLALKGRERTDMLERIFALEQFGERLNRNLKSRLEEAATTIKILVSEMNGIGDASDTALELAQAVMEQAEREAAAAEEEEEAARVHYEAQREVWELQEAMEEVQAKIGQLQAYNDKIEGLRRMASRARQAEEVRPFLEAADLLGQKAQAARNEFEAMKTEEERQRHGTEGSREELRQAEQEWQTSAPAINSRIDKLRELYESEQESREGHHQLSRLQAELRNEGEKLGQLQKQLGQLEKAKKSDEAELVRLGEVRRNLRVEPERREKINQAMRLLPMLEKAQETRANAVKNLRDREREVLKGEETLAGVDQAYEVLQKQTGDARQASDNLKAELARCLEPEEYMRHHGVLEQLEQARSRWQQNNEKIADLKAGWEIRVREHRDLLDQIRELEGQRIAGQEIIHDLSERYQQENELNQAVHLAGSLEEGGPCPVCGSLQHPRPAVPTKEDCRNKLDAEINHQQAVLKDIEGTLAGLNTKMGAAQAALEMQEALQHEAQSQLEETARVMAAWLEKLPPQLRELPYDSVRQWIDDRKIDYEQKDSALRELEQSLMGWERELGSVLAEREKQNAVLAQWRRLLEEISASLELAAREEEELTRLFAETAQGLDPAALREQDRLIKEKDREALELENSWQSLTDQLQKTDRELEELRAGAGRAEQELAVKQAEAANLEQALSRLDGQIAEATGGKPVKDIMAALDQELQRMEHRLSDCRRQAHQSDQMLEAAVKDLSAAQARADVAADRCHEAAADLDLALSRCHFASAGEARTALAGKEELISWEDSIRQFEEESKRLADQKTVLEEKLQGSAITREQWEWAGQRLQSSHANSKDTLKKKAVAQNNWQMIEGKNRRWREIEQEQQRWQEQNNRLQLLQSTLKGKDFVRYIAGEQLRYICHSASLRLQQLSRSRYGLELDSENNFVIRDDHNGGQRRAVATLSGGETFLASLALALALSAQIQLRGQYPLEFFFLDEGFGTLDPDLLETVINSLESLRHERFMIGIISHVPELRNRLPRYLQVIPAEPGGYGTELKMK